jgi:glycyl-tRNA synthetase beta chain
MSEFFLELFSEEIPSSLQKTFRNDLLNNFNSFFSEKFISFKKSSSYSTPNRLIIIFEGLQKKIVMKSEEIKGPNINAPEIALEGFMRSNNISKKDLFKKKIDKGEFYFFKTKSKKLNTHELLEKFVPIILQKNQWKKSMRWGEFDLNWGRPLKSILAIFDKKKLIFDFHHITSSNSTFIDKEFEEKKKLFNDFKSYENFFKKEGIIVNHNKRKEVIRKEFEKILNKKNLKIKDNEKLIEEVVNLTDKPHVIHCSFDKKFLSIPKEILVLTMQLHQKYFPLFTKKDEITNEFLVVANNKDKNGFIRIGNERVIEARLSDAEFFWNKDKSKNLVKKVSELKSMNFFKGLGSYFDKVQRMRKLGALISDELLISKEKVELSASICKTDLMSESVREFPELQGIMGGYLSQSQGFDKEIVEAIKEQYLPVGLDSIVPKKPFGITLSISDKIDTLVGFFGANQIPSSSKDPYALRRAALGIIRIIIENKKDLKINDYISYSSNLYENQDLSFQNKKFHNDISVFLKDRFRFYLKERNIRYDIIESSINAFDLNKISLLFEKSKSLNKVINDKVGNDIISTYKRAFNILQSEVKDISSDLSNTTDPGIFKNDFEKNLYKKINELKKYFSGISGDENFDETLILLSNAKKEIFDFFDNVKVNDDSYPVKKNRLELINILCKTFENFTNFHLIKDINE